MGPTVLRLARDEIFDTLRGKWIYSRSILLHSNDMHEPAQPLNINTLYNVYVVEKLIQLTIESIAEIIANSHWTEDLM